MGGIKAVHLLVTSSWWQSATVLSLLIFLNSKLRIQYTCCRRRLVRSSLRGQSWPPRAHHLREEIGAHAAAVSLLQQLCAVESRKVDSQLPCVSVRCDDAAE